MHALADKLANKKIFFAGILFFGLLAMTARNATDPDLWWHLRTGQWILSTGSVPDTDPFSFTRAGKPWVSHEWLSDLTFYFLWKSAGPTSLIIFSSVVTTIGFLFLYWRCPGRPSWAAAAVVLGAWACAPCWGVRPQMFTFTLASLLLWLLERSEQRPRLLLWIPPLFLLWLNLHAGFALGPALLGLYSVGLALEAIAGATSSIEVRPILVRALLTMIVCLALVPLNPNGVHLYRYPLDTLRSQGMRSFIVEWFSPDFHQALYAPLLLVWLSLIIALTVSRSHVKGRFLVPLLFTAFASLDAVRHVPIFVLLAIPAICTVLPTPDARDLALHPTPDHFRPAFRAAAILLLACFAVLRWVTLVHSQQAREAELFPQRAVAFFERTQLPSRAFVYYDWGGYAIWNLYPRYRVFVDGRADLYADGVLRQFRNAIDLRPSWRAVLNDAGVETVLVPVTCALAQGLALDPAWHETYRDSQAVAFVRHPPNSPRSP